MSTNPKTESWHEHQHPEFGDKLPVAQSEAPGTNHTGSEASLIRQCACGRDFTDADSLGSYYGVCQGCWELESAAEWWLMINCLYPGELTLEANNL